MTSPDTRLTRRAFTGAAVGGAAALAAAVSFSGRTFAQSATPAASPVPLTSINPNLPTIKIVASDQVFNITVPGGGVVEGQFDVQLVNETTNTIANANFVKLPDGTSVGDFTSVLSKSFKGEGGDLPDWWKTASFAGGSVVAPGHSAQSILDLSAGQWVVFSSTPAATQSPQVISVASLADAAAASGAATPAAGATPVLGVTQGDNTISISDTGITTETPPTSSQKLWRVSNTSTTQVVDLVVLKVEAGADPVALAAAYASGGTVNGLAVAGAGTLSAGASDYIGGALEAGTYALFSSLPDSAKGGLQSANGVATLVTIA
jgi:hypothetical protein